MGLGRTSHSSIARNELSELLEYKSPFNYFLDDYPLSMLELGCSTGLDAYTVLGDAPKNSRYIGVDIDDVRIARARERYPKLSFESSDGSVFLQDHQESFDLIFSFHPEVIHNPGSHDMMASVSLGLKPGGVLYSTVFSSEEFEAMKRVFCSSSLTPLVLEQIGSEWTLFAYLCIAQNQ